MMAERAVGSETAPITVIEYFSLTCGHCANFHLQTLPRVKSELIETGRLRLIYRDFPLDRVALAAHMVARGMPAERYGAFLDTLFRTQSQWAGARDPIGALAQLAAVAGMDRARFDSILGNEALQRAILEVRLKGEQQDRVEGTPTFIASTGRRVSGAANFERFLELAGGTWPAAPAVAPGASAAPAAGAAPEAQAIPDPPALRPIPED
jgi:protein-disulfide isomerase